MTASDENDLLLHSLCLICFNVMPGHIVIGLIKNVTEGALCKQMTCAQSFIVICKFFVVSSDSV